MSVARAPRHADTFAYNSHMNMNNTDTHRHGKTPHMRIEEEIASTEYGININIYEV